MKFRSAQIIPVVFLLTLISSCNKTEKQWQFERKIILPIEARPLALAKDGEALWFSDPDYFRLYKIDLNGKVLDSITGIQRPMNIHFDNGKLYIPEFLTDTIWQYENGNLSHLKINHIPQAPAGLSVYGDTILIADFYNHRIIIETTSSSATIGKQGHKEGQLYYPIDVKLKDNKVYVADAYNNRVQVFDFDGTYRKTIGVSEKLNVASGISLSENELAITNQENNQVLIYTIDGELLQVLSQNFVYPTDVLLDGDTLYVTNFKENAILIYNKANSRNK